QRQADEQQQQDREHRGLHAKELLQRLQQGRRDRDVVGGERHRAGQPRERGRRGGQASDQGIELVGGDAVQRQRVLPLNQQGGRRKDLHRAQRVRIDDELAEPEMLALVRVLLRLFGGRGEHRGVGLPEVAVRTLYV